MQFQTVLSVASLGCRLERLYGRLVVVVRYIMDTNQLFLHIPKTAGVAIESAIEAKWLERRVWKLRHRWNGIPGRHPRRRDLREFKRGFEWEPEAWAFCFVRHPVQWYVSCWRHLHQMTKRRVRRGSNLADMFRWYKWHPQAWLGQILSTDFDEWIGRIAADRPGFLSDLYEEYVGLDQSTPHVQYVGRMETLVADADELLGISKLPRKNRSTWPKPDVSQQTIEGIIGMEMRAMQRYYSTDTIGFRYIEDWAG